MSVSTSFNPPQFEDTYDGLKMRQLIDELMRLQAEFTRTFDWILAKQEALQFTGIDGVPIDAIAFEASSGDSDFASVRLLVDADGADAATSYTERSVNAAVATFVGDAQLDTDQFKFGTASILLDGTGDYVTFPDNAALELGSGAFTIEGWVRFNALPAVGEEMSLVSQWEGSGTDRAFDLFIRNHAVFGFSIKFEWVDASGLNIESGSIDPVDPVINTWYHFAVIRDAADALFIWWDGAREFNSSPGIFSGTIDNTTVTTKLGVRDPGVGGGNEQYLNGWLDDVRITVGVERYDTSGDITTPSEAFLTVGDVAEFTFGNSATDINLDGDLTLTGRLVTDDSTATRAGFNIPTGAAPTSSVQGDIWVEAADIFASLNGVDQSLIFVDWEQTTGDLPHILEVAGELQLDNADITVSSNGTVITFSVEKSGGGDIRILFSDGVFTHDTDPTPDTIALNVGTDTSPQINYVYLLKSTGVLTVSTAGWPSAEHSRYASILCQSAASAQTDGVYKMHAWSDHTDSAVAHEGFWIRSQPATWKSGTLATTSVGAATFDIAVAAGVVQQLHEQNYPAFNTATGSEIMIVNQNGAAFDRVGNMVSQITDASGGSMSGKYYSLVVWGVQSEDSGDCQLMVNLPTASYNTSARAILDVDATTVYDIPTNFIGTGFLIARLVVRHQAGGNTYSISSNIDLRGKVPSTSAGGTAGGGVKVLADIDDVSQVSPTQFHALARNAGNTGWESRLLVEADISDLQAYLTSFTETNDLSAAVTWANVPEANIPTHTGHVTGGTSLALVVAAITGQTALTTGLADTDEFLISDGGVIKRMDASVLATYIGAAAEVNDLSSVVTWANVPEANIPTHTGHVTGGTSLALVVAAITGQTALASGLVDTDEFLISDAGVIKRMDASVLATYIGAVTSEVNDLSSVVTWANVPDANITQGSVTQHEAALTILESQVTDGSILARVASAETILADWTWNDSKYIYLGTGKDVGIMWNGTRLHIVGKTASQFIYFNDGPHIRIYDDSDTDWLELDHDGVDFNFVFSGTADWNVSGITNLQLAANLVATGAVTGSNLNVANWDTAYGWGDHDAVGYLTSEATHTGHVTGDAALTLVVAAITGQTALAAGLVDTDEFLISDGGVIKRMDASVLATYIGAAAEVNDLSSVVTWANIPEANVPTHTGEVTGGTALTVDTTAITAKTAFAEVLVGTDELLLADVWVGDPDFDDVVLLLDFAGSDGATDITDLSNSGHVDTFNNQAEVDTDLQFIGTNSVLLDGVSDTVSFPDHADWDFGTGDFTVEVGVRFSNLASGTQVPISNYAGGTGDNGGWAIQKAPGNLLKFFHGDVTVLSESWTPVINTWYHIAVSRNGSTLRIFVDGTQLGSGTSITEDFVGSTTSLFVGGLTATLQEVFGNVAAVRVTKGVGRYTANFTAPVVFYDTPSSGSDVIRRMAISSLETYMQTNLTFSSEVNDLTAAVTWANIPEANVPTHTGEITGGTALTLDVTAITAKTALASGLASTDELLLSDAGVIKRMDVSVIEAYMLANLGFLTAETNDLTAAVTWANVPEANVPTHTGDVIGGTALTIDPTAISGKALVTAASGDMLLVWDATDSALKRANFDDFGGGGGVTIAVVAARAFGGM